MCILRPTGSRCSPLLYYSGSQCSPPTLLLGFAPQGCFVALPSLRSEKTLGRALTSRFPKSVQMLRIFTEIWHSVVLSSQNTFASTTSTYVRARTPRVLCRTSVATLGKNARERAHQPISEKRSDASHLHGNLA